MFFQNIYSKKFLINLLILFIPFSYISGNLILNLNILLLIVVCLFIFQLDIFKNKFSQNDILILAFFLYILFNGVFNNFLNFKFENAPNQNVVLIKSLLLFRFLLLYFIIKYLIVKEIINFKYLFYSFAASCLFVSVDLIIQYIFGQDLFGFVNDGRRFAGPFGDEYIAGSFIQRFFIFLPFSIILFSKVKKPILSQLILFIVILLSIFGLIIAGNRVPLVLFLIILALLFVYEKKVRRLLLILVFSLILTLSYLIKIDKNFHNHYIGFVTKSFQVIDYLKTRIFTGEVKAYPGGNLYIKEFESGILTWQENKLFGGGVKSFFWNCKKIDRDKMRQFVSKRGEVNCNSHPHNYYLQIAGELGLVGLLILIIMFLKFTLEGFKNIHGQKMNFDQKKILIPFFIIFLTEIFPLKTTGSFFTTTNSTFLFIILAFVVGLIDFKNKTYE